MSALRPAPAPAPPPGSPPSRRSTSRRWRRLRSPQLLHEFHHHRLGATIDGVEYADAEVDFFDDLVKGVDARRDELDALIAAKLAKDWSLARLDKPMRQILRAGAYELVARADVADRAA